MEDMTQYVNLGKVVNQQLHNAGIHTLDQLKEIGSVQAALRLGEANVDVCASKLFALEGAIRGIRWNFIPKEERDLLKQELEDAWE